MRLFFILFKYLAFTFVLTSNAEAEHFLDQKTNGNEWIHQPETTYEKFLPHAVEGDPEIQNFLGFMFFYGEGVLQDYKEAHTWFHQAAEQGNLKAQTNLVFFHSGAVIIIPQEYKNLEEAYEWARRAGENCRHIEGLGKFRIDGKSEPESPVKNTVVGCNLDIGEKIYLTFCAGCHGFNATTTYSNTSPFMLGERLQKDNATLMDSIINGKGDMPAWGESLGENLLAYTLAYVRIKLGVADVNRKLQTHNKTETVDGDAMKAGERLFTTFCAGCHGFNGIAQYVNSPSFALSERLNKSDHELESSIANMKRGMPSWGNKLSSNQIRNIILFIRTLPLSFQDGIAGSLRSKSEFYFRFRPLGETGIEWLGADPIGIRPPEEQ